MEEQEETTYHTPNGIIKKLDTFKGKKALIGDYFAPSYYNTKMVLDSLGFEMTIVKTYYDVIEKIKKGEKYDVIFTNNIYQIGGTGPQLLKELKEIEGFDIPVIIHTISEQPIDYFLSLGFNGCLKKPIKQDETIQVLKKIFKYDLMI